MPAEGRGTPREILVATFLLSASIFQLQIALTRIFSVMTWHHFTFMIISLALLGFGAAGAYIATYAPATALAVHARRYALAMVFSFFLVTRIHFEPLNIATDWTQSLSLFYYAVFLTLPFLFAGFCIGTIVRDHASDIHRVYFADLLGASAGSLSTVWVLGRIGAPSLIFLAAFLGAVVGVILSSGEGAAVRRGHVATAGALGLLLVFGVLVDPFIVFSPSSKDIFADANPWVGAKKLDFSRWHLVARVDVTKPVSWGGGKWEWRVVYQDGGAPTYISRSDGDVSKLTYLSTPIQALPYKMRAREKVLVIGVGGGHDILIALYHGARDIFAAEINPVMIRAITKDFGDYAGRLFERPEVHISVSEGRHFVSRSSDRYDVIQLSGVDTFAATSAGANALAEGYIYTVEAMQDYYRHLTPDGIVGISRMFVRPPRETLRMAATMVEALERLGVPEPWRHIAIARRDDYVNTLLQAAPLTREEMAEIRRFCQLQGREVMYDPFEDRGSPYDQLIRATDREPIYAASPFDIRPCTDDNPFFFDYYRWRSLWVTPASKGGYQASNVPIGLLTLAWSLVLVVLLAVIGILAPMRSQQFAGRRGAASVSLYFASLGVGFMFVEITLIQSGMVFLGGPTYSLAFTLSVILFFSGVGSLVARRLEVTGRVFRVLAISIPLVVLALGPLLTWGVSRWLGLAWAGRAALMALMIAPAAFLMGMPFPTGLKLLTRRMPEWVPWAWSINAFMTVVGPLVCVLLALHVGFRVVFATAALVYAAGFLAYLPILAFPEAPESPRS